MAKNPLTTLRHRRLLIFTLFSALLFASLRTGSADDEKANQKLPLPSTAQVRDAQKEVRSIFDKDYSAAKTPNAKLELAEKLIDQAQKNENDAIAFYALLREARDLAADAEKWSVAVTAIEQIEEKFEVDTFELKQEFLTAAIKESRAATAHQELCHAASDVLDQAVEAQQFEQAYKISQALSASASRIRDVDVRKQILSKTAEFKKLHQEWSDAQSAATRLKEMPDDAAANAKYGRYLCLSVRDWERGLALLMKGNNAKLKTLAQLELADPVSTQEQMKLADAWWDFGQSETGNEKKQALLRAKLWYQKAEPELSGLAKTKANKRLESLNAAYPDGLSAAKKVARGNSKVTPREMPKQAEPPAPLPPRPNPPNVQFGTALDHEVAKLVIEQKGNVYITIPNVNGQITLQANSKLPDAPFVIRTIFVSTFSPNPDIQFPDENCKLVAKLTGLHYIHFFGAPVTDAAFAFLSTSKSLGHVNASGTKITDNGVQSLSKLSFLQDLDLSETQISDAGMVHLQQCTQLRSLNISKTQVTGAGLQRLARCLNLNDLVLRDLALQDADLAALEGLRNLSALHLTGTPITGEGLKSLKGKIRPRVLALDATQINEAGAAQLGGLTSVKVLFLGRTGFNDAAMRHLRGLVNLEELSLQSTNVTDAGLNELGVLPNLKSLSLQGAGVTGEGLTVNSRLLSLTTLDLTNSRTTDSGTQNLVAAYPNVRTLVLSHTAVTDAGLKHLKKLRQLNTLLLPETQVTEKGLLQLSDLPALQTLVVPKTITVGPPLKAALPRTNIQPQ